jgi:hypothetical protein
MPTVHFTIGQNDRLPDLARTLKDADGVAVDLTTASAIKFHMRPYLGGTAVVNADATAVSLAAGQVKYVWGATDTATAGLFRGEFQATFAGKTYTFPNTSEKIVIEITEQIA